jgi:GNAT superfamily N-acetyltransferase
MAMDETEYQLQKESFYDRYLRLNQTEIDSAIRIVDYTPEYAKAFYDLNHAWISETYEVEPEDEKILSDPAGYYLNDGGAILIVLYNDEPVGTCALKRRGPDVVEMSKMTVSKAMRGKKIGNLLGNAILVKAKEIGAKKVILNSNRKGSAAGVSLYLKLGFVEVPIVEREYKRADIKMELDLK